MMAAKNPTISRKDLIKIARAVIKPYKQNKILKPADERELMQAAKTAERILASGWVRGRGQTRCGCLVGTAFPRQVKNKKDGGEYVGEDGVLGRLGMDFDDLLHELIDSDHELVGCFVVDVVD